MTSELFCAILIIVSSILFIGIGIILSSALHDSVGFGISTIITIVFVLIFGLATPSMEQMIENDYHAMLKDRPKCIDAGDTSLGCKKDYIDWQRDSIEKQRKYDSAKVKLENLQKEVLK